MSRTVVIAMEGCLAILRGEPGSMRAEIAMEGLAPRCLAAEPLSAGAVYCGTAGRGLWRSDDYGATWHAVSTTFPQDEITALASAPEPRTGTAGGSALYVGTEPSHLYRTRNGGARWEPLDGFLALPSAPSWSFPPKPDTHHVRWIEPDPHDAEALYLCVEAGALVRTSDGGRRWQDRTPHGPYDTHTLATHRLAPGRLYAAAGDGYFESEDGGQTWSHREDGLRHLYLVGLAVDPRDSRCALVSAAPSPRHAYTIALAQSYVYRRVAPGPWVEARDGLPAPRGMLINLLVVDPSRPQAFFTVNNHGLYRSEDFGTTWQACAPDWPEGLRTQQPHAIVLLAASGEERGR